MKWRKKEIERKKKRGGGGGDLKICISAVHLLSTDHVRDLRIQPVLLVIRGIVARHPRVIQQIEKGEPVCETSLVRSPMAGGRRALPPEVRHRRRQALCACPADDILT